MNHKDIAMALVEKGADVAKLLGGKTKNKKSSKRKTRKSKK